MHKLPALMLFLFAVLSPAESYSKDTRLPSEFDAVVTHVTDGDTFRFKASLLNVDINDVCRMREYNAPEIHGAEKIAGGKAKSMMIKLVGGKRIHVRTFGRDKYGRWLCTATTGTVSLGAEMREYLKSYPGKDKYLQRQVAEKK